MSIPKKTPAEISGRGGDFESRLRMVLTGCVGDKARWSLETMCGSNTIEQEYSTHGVGCTKSQGGDTGKIERNEVHVQI